LAVTALLGAVGGVVYALAALAVVAVGVARGRRVLAPPTRASTPRPAGRTCTCCTSTVHDPVEVRP
ncbi:MAG TPA: hypothetical protein VFR07_15520, partial [Mycobacteriales bacterium]|nr:hypothetical protein [Mycobacteriales bacterium]